MRPQPLFRAVPAVILLLAFTFVACQQEAAESDETPPTLSLRLIKTNGTQRVNPGQTAMLAHKDLNASGPEGVTVIARDTEGVKRLNVTWSGRGTCHTKGGSTPVTAPDPLSFSFKPVSSVATGDQVFKDSTSVFLGGQMREAAREAEPRGVSCGTHQYVNMDSPQEFFSYLATGTRITVVAEAENCCGGVTDGEFTIEMA